MSAERRYFWCDAPSPLHEARERAVAEHSAAVEELRQLAVSLGATDSVVDGSGIVKGFLFNGEPPKCSYHWQLAGKDRDGDAYYIPQRRTADGKRLRDRMMRPSYTPAPDAVAHASGMYVHAVQGGLFRRTTSGWKDDRIFISVPLRGEAGDPFPEIPSYLTECAKWELERWFDVGRSGVLTNAVAEATS